MDSQKESLLVAPAVDGETYIKRWEQMPVAVQERAKRDPLVYAVVKTSLLAEIFDVSTLMERLFEQQAAERDRLHVMATALAHDSVAPPPGWNSLRLNPEALERMRALQMPAAERGALLRELLAMVEEPARGSHAAAQAHTGGQ